MTTLHTLLFHLLLIEIKCDNLTLTWHSKPQLYPPYDYFVQGAILGYLPSTQKYYYMGGLNEKGFRNYMNEIYIWNNITNQWELSPYKYHDGFYVDADQFIIVNHTFYIFNPFSISSNNSFQYNGELWTFNGTTTNRYPLSQTHMQYPVSFGCTVTNGSHVFIIGGQPEVTVYSNRIQLFDLFTMKYLNISLATIPIGLSHHTCQFDAQENNIYVFGGYYSNGFTNTIYKYDVNDNKWVLLNSTLSIGKGYLASIIYLGNNARIIYLIGGRTETGDTSNVVEIFDIENEQCDVSKHSALPTGAESAAVYFDKFYFNGIVLIGGKNTPTTYNRYSYVALIGQNDHVQNQWSLFGLGMVEVIMIAVALFVIISGMIIFYACKCRKRNDRSRQLSFDFDVGHVEIDHRKTSSNNQNEGGERTALL